MNKLRRITLATLAGGVAAGVGFKAFGHGRRHAYGPIDPAELDRHVDRMLKHLYVEIDATDAQKQKLDPIVREAAKELAPMRENLHAARREAIELLAQERVDPAALEALRAKHLQLADQASRRLTRAIAEAADVLTPAQRKELAAHFARRHGRWAHG
jgi:protein CpxP